MLLSEHIESLMKILKEKGDQELFMWVNTGQDTVYVAKVPELDVGEIDGNEFQIPKDLRNRNGNILIVTNLESDSFDEDNDSLQDLELEVEEREEREGE